MSSSSQPPSHITPAPMSPHLTSAAPSPAVSATDAGSQQMMMLILTEMRDAAQNHRAEMRDLIRKQEESVQVAKEQHRAEMRKQDQMIQMLKEDREQHRAEMREIFRKQEEDREQHRAEMRELFRLHEETMQKTLNAFVKALERKDPWDEMMESITNTRLVQSLLTFLYAPLQHGKISPPPPYSP